MASSVDLEMMRILLEVVKPDPNIDCLFNAIIAFSTTAGIASEKEISKHFGVGIKTIKMKVVRPEIYKWLLERTKELQKSQN